MEVSQARAFLAVAEELHFGRAAARLHMAQPPLSRLILRLEAEVGARLFDRNTRAVSLTHLGAALVEPARELVLQSERMSEVVRRSVAGETGRLRLGFAGSSVIHLVGPIARAVRVERPGIRLELVSSQFSQAGLERVVDGSLDLLVGRWDFLPARVESLLLEAESLVVALPTFHTLARAARLDASALRDETWIPLQSASGGILSNRLNLLGASAGFVPRTGPVAPDSATQLMLVGAGAGVALTFTTVAENVPSTGVLYREPTPAQPGVEVRLIWRRGEGNPALTEAVRVIRAAFGPGPDSPGTE
jgi:DNA-binding transcriptional LysR family regulator